MSDSEEVALSSLTPDELKQELLDCARYGEEDDLLAILEHTKDVGLRCGVNINAEDEGGNTALHKASANGHVGCVNLLVKHEAYYGPNRSGNTPLHYASCCGKVEVAQLLFKAYPQADVLAKNGFGQGALSEAFRSNNTDMVALLLAHPSSEEDKLMPSNDASSADAQRAAAVVGRRITLTGLSKAEMNGKIGVCVGIDHGEGGGSNAERLLVTLEEKAPSNSKSSSKGKTVKVKRKNVTIIKTAAEESEDKATAALLAAREVEGANPEEETIEHVFSFAPSPPCDSAPSSLHPPAPTAADSSSSAAAAEPPLPILRVREKAMTRADTPFQTDEHEDSTGLSIWCASLVLARWCADDNSNTGAAAGDESGTSLASTGAEGGGGTNSSGAARVKCGLSPLLRGKEVIELGAGVGVSGLSAALYARPKLALLTDLNEDTVLNLRHNASLLPPSACRLLEAEETNEGSRDYDKEVRAEEAAAAAAAGEAAAAAAATATTTTSTTTTTPMMPASLKTVVDVSTLDWGDIETWPKKGKEDASPKTTKETKSGECEPWRRFEVVMGCDLVYDNAIAPLLGKCVGRLLDQDRGVFVYVAPPDGRAGLPRFLQDELVRKLGLVLVLETLAPAAYSANPLHSQDATAAFLHFSELSLPYVLRVFARPAAAKATAALFENAPSSTVQQLAAYPTTTTTPAGHTPYSWGRGRDDQGGLRHCPAGHTSFSWGAAASL